MPRCPGFRVGVQLFPAILLCVVAGGCGPDASSRPSLAPVSLPDLSGADSSYQAQVRDAYASLTHAREHNVAASDLAAAYGRPGMLLQAGNYNDAAEPFYRNAGMLAPDDPRWPYYLGHLSKSEGDARQAELHFKRALALRPGDVAIQVWLGRLLLDDGRPDEAEPLFAGALKAEPRSVAALAGLGQVSLARRDYARAAGHFEQALDIDPEADSLHAPLALAYRGLGQARKAEAHERQWVNRDILVSDPMQQDLDMLIESGLSYELRGVRSLDASDWVSAAAYFQKGLALTPQNSVLRRSLLHKLGTALFLAGERQRAEEQFHAVVSAAPDNVIDEPAARAHYSLGVMAAASGRDPEAEKHFAGALKYQPSYAEAHFAFADALRRSNHFEAALSHYAEVIRIRPNSAEARFGYGMSLVRLGRYAEARDWFSAAMALHPDRPQFAHALARVLAAAPDDRVRDGARALELIRGLFATDQTTELGETMAMGLAETGDFDAAVGIQRGIIDAARRGGARELAARMSGNLRRYERREPCRTPWSPDDPVHRPAPPGLDARAGGPAPVSPAYAARRP